MYMDLSTWDIENRRSFEQTSMTMSSTPSSSHSKSLPPLHQAIPEFRSHIPQERRSSSVPRKLAEGGSSSFRQPHRISPSSSSAIPDAGIATPGEPTEGAYDAQTYLFPGQLESRRMSGMSSNSSPHVMDPRPSPYLPPVSSLTSSRGSSFDMESSERPPGSSTLPLLYNSHQPSHSSYPAQYENDAARSQQSTPDYPRYSSAPAISASPYQSSSPGSQYAQHYAYSQQSRPQTGYGMRPPVAAGGGSPFSTPGHPADLNMDHFEQGRPGKRRRGNLPKQVTDLLRSWLNEHLHHPYPTEDEKQMLMAQTGLTIHQISNWFINARRRRIPAITNSDSKSSGTRRPSAGQ